jgi:hypothetical protein
VGRPVDLAGAHHAAEDRLSFAGTVRFLNGLPGIIIACLAAFAAFQMYVHQREQTAVARAQWVHTRDSLRNVIVAESLAADARDRVRGDTIKALTKRLAGSVTAAAAEGRRATVFHDALHELVDSNATAKAALDSLEASHARQVVSLERAVAISASLLLIERARVADRDAQLREVRAQLVGAITRADDFERQAHPGWITRVLRSPGTHLVAAGLGFALGSK